MKMLHRFISAGFATAALASASVPALAFSVWPDVDFEWYANAGRPTSHSVEVFPAPREGYIWAPSHYEWRGSREVWVKGHWIRDDYAEQVALYSGRAAVAQGPMVLRDRDGNVIPTSPDAYPIDSSRR